MQAGPTAQAGEAAYMQRCGGCHSLQPGDSRMGPLLNKVINRKAGSLPGYAYSAALTSSKLTWNRATLDAFLASPTKVAPGTRMVSGVSDAATRSAIIDYLAATENSR
jgi:cytochrome c